MSKVFEHRKRVEFCETDAAGIVYFASYLSYMEQAEHALYRSIGTSVMFRHQPPHGNDQRAGFPRVHCEASYSGVARFEDELVVRVRVRKLGTSSVTYAFTVLRTDNAEICEGSITAVCCELTGGTLKSMPIPQDIRSSLEEYLIDTPSN